MTTKRSEYTEKMKTQLDALNARIDALEKSANDVKDDMRESYATEVVKVRHQSKLAKQKMEDMLTTSEEAWDKAVAEMDKITDAFVHSFNYFKSQV